MKTVQFLLEEALTDLLVGCVERGEFSHEKAFSIFVEVVKNRRGILKTSSRYMVSGVDTIYELIPEEMERVEKILDGSAYHLIPKNLEIAIVVMFSAMMELLGELVIAYELESME